MQSKAGRGNLVVVCCHPGVSLAQVSHLRSQATPPNQNLTQRRRRGEGRGRGAIFDVRFLAGPDTPDTIE